MSDDMHDGPPVTPSPFIDYGLKAQDAAEHALEQLYEDEEEYGGCLCDTCIVRTVLEAAWPIFEESVQ